MVSESLYLQRPERAVELNTVYTLSVCLRLKSVRSLLPQQGRRVGERICSFQANIPDALSMAAAKRLRKELDEMAQNPEPFCTAGPVGGDLFAWQAVLTGPPDSPYDGNRFLL